MRRVLRLTPLAVLLVVLGLAVGLPWAGAITDGTPDTTHTNVGLLYMNDIPVLSVGMCSGALIAPKELLVAGHCTATFTAVGLRPADVNVSFDRQYSLTDAGVIETEHPLAVTGWETHPGYVGTPYSPTDHIVDDVGVIHLAKKVAGASPVELPPIGFLDAQAARGGLRGHEIVNVGYGMNGLDRSISSPQVNITWDLQREVSTSLFKALWPNNFLVDGGTCLGDSGGPRFFGDSTLQVGVTSTGDPTCGNEDSPQRLDVKPVHDWLQGIIAGG